MKKLLYLLLVALLLSCKSYEPEKDNPPIFDKTLYSFTVASSAVAGTQIGSVSASDPDGDEIAYSMATASQQFALNGSTGVITVKTGGNLTETSYSLTVQAANPRQNTATVSVNITIVKFMFDKTFYRFNVVSSTVAGTEIGSVSASDPDGDEITYSMAVVSQQFALNGSTGVITVKTGGNLTETFYSLTVQAANESGNNEAVTVLINITDITDMVTKISGMFVETQVSTGEVHVSVVDGIGFSSDQHGGQITKIYLDNTDKGSLVQLHGFERYHINDIEVKGKNTTGYINHVIRHNDGIFFTSSDDSPLYAPGRSNWVILGGRPFTRGAIAFAAWMQIQNVLIVSSLKNSTVISATDGRPLYCDDILDSNEFIPLCGELDDYIAYSGVGINNIVFVGAIDSEGLGNAAIRKDGVFAPHAIYISSPDGSTSQATPIVAAIATEIAHANPSYSPSEIKQALMDRATIEEIDHINGINSFDNTITEKRRVRILRR